MANPTSRNEGEGNRTADRNYREATREFVESERGKDKGRERRGFRFQRRRAGTDAGDHVPAEAGLQQFVRGIGHVRGRSGKRHPRS